MSALKHVGLILITAHFRFQSRSYYLEVHGRMHQLWLTYLPVRVKHRLGNRRVNLTKDA